MSKIWAFVDTNVDTERACKQEMRKDLKKIMHQK